MDSPLYVPSKWGSEFHALTCWEALGAGSAGPGKTEVLIHEPDQQVVVEHQRCSLDKKHPHYHPWGTSTGWALYLRRELTMLDQTMARANRAYITMDPGYSFNQQKKTGTFSSGYKIQFGHCANPDDWQAYFSNEYTLILFDELTQFEEEQYENITARLRSTDPVLSQMLKIRSMSNPFFRREGVSGVKDPFWVRRRFVEPARQGRVRLTYKVTLPSGKVIERDRIYLPAKLQDNPDKTFVDQYYATLASKPDHIRKALLEGDWYFVAGAFFSDDFDPKRHVVRPFSIPRHWRRFRSMDWGFQTQGVVGWFAIDDDGKLVCYREFSFKKMHPREVAERIREHEEREGIKWRGGRSPVPGVADTQLWEMRGDTGKSKAEEFAELGVSWRGADKRSRARNAERVLNRLRAWEKNDPVPGLVFFETCKKCVQTIPSIMPDDNDPESPAKGGEDHWLDMVMYACAYASRDENIPHHAESDDEDYKPVPSGTWGYGY